MSNNKFLEKLKSIFTQDVEKINLLDCFTEFSKKNLKYLKLK